MRFFPGLTPSILSRLNPVYKNQLHKEVIRLSARETLRTMFTIQAAMAEPSDVEAKQMKMNLVQQAFPEDEQTQATLIEALSRG